MENLPVLNPIVNVNVIGLPEIGKIKIGAKGKGYQNKKGYTSYQPQKNDHFTITTLERDRDDNLKKNIVIHKELEKKYGTNPKQIPIKLMYNDIALNYQSRFACYNGKSPICVGDGANAITYQTKDGKVTESGSKKCPCERAEREKGDKGRCTVKCRLSVILDCETTSTGGVWIFRSGGFYSSMGLRQSLKFIHEATYGRMAGVPLIMTVRPQTAQVAMYDKTTKQKELRNVTIYAVGVVFQGSINALQVKAFEIANKNAFFAAKMEAIEETARKTIAYEQSLLIEAPDISEEFHPEENQDAIENPEKGQPKTAAETEPIEKKDSAVTVVIENATEEVSKKTKPKEMVVKREVVGGEIKENFLPEETKEEENTIEFGFGTATKTPPSSKETEQTDIDFSF